MSPQLEFKNKCLEFLHPIRLISTDIYQKFWNAISTQEGEEKIVKILGSISPYLYLPHANKISEVTDITQLFNCNKNVLIKIENSWAEIFQHNSSENDVKSPGNLFWYFHEITHYLSLYYIIICLLMTIIVSLIRSLIVFYCTISLPVNW